MDITVLLRRERRKRLGDHEIVNLAEDRGYLMLELSMSDHPDQIERAFLMPKSDVEALLLSLLRGGGAGVKVVVVDGEERLEISGYQARRIAH